MQAPKLYIFRAFAGVVIFSACLVPNQGTADNLSPTDEEIGNMPLLEMTFIPEARKKPIFIDMLTGDMGRGSIPKWKLKDGTGGKKKCEALLTSLVAWTDVEIVEPTKRANRYGDPVFSRWRKACPNFIPHRMDMVTGPDPYYLGSFHFKAFQLDEFGELNERAVLYYQGLNSPKFVDWLEGPKANATIQNDAGYYVAVDLNKCRIASSPWVPAQAFSYYRPESKPHGQSESAIIRVLGKPFLIGISTTFAQGGRIIRDRFLAAYLLQPGLSKAPSPFCRFWATETSANKKELSK